MVEHIQTELPFWLASIGLMLAIFLSFWSYSGKRNRELFSVGLRFFLGFLRGLGFFILFILFIGLYWKKQSSVNEKPLYVIAIDNSKSIIAGNDSLERINELKLIINAVSEEIGDKFDIKKIKFGEDVSLLNDLDFSDKSTNFGKLFKYLRSSFYTQPVSELLLITDGISTTGQSFISSNSLWPHPMSVIGLGDTTESVDLRIEDVIVNDLVYLNSRFPIDIIVQAEKSQQNLATLELSVSGKLLADTVIVLDRFDGKGQVSLIVEASELGNQVYEISLAPLDNEQNLYNNTRKIAIEVVDQKHQAILIFQSPNPDIRIIEETLTESGNYDLTIWPVDLGVPNFNDYQVAIVYQLPGSGSNEDAIITKLIQSELNTLIITGPKTSLTKLGSHYDVIAFPNDRKLNEDFSGKINEQFDLFLLPENLSEFLSEMPPLRAPLTGIELNGQATVLLRQTIKGVELSDPLVWFMRNGNAKIGFWWGEGLWRWNLFEYLSYGDHFYTKSLVSAVINFLAVDELEDPLKIDVPGSISSFEKLVFKARLYNESFEMINTPDLYIDLAFPDGTKRKLEFRKLDGKYWLDIDQLIPGQIEYKCYTHISNQEYSKSGVIQVLETALENLDTRARFDDLRTFANQKGGEFFTLDQQSELLTYIGKLDTDQSSLYNENRWVNLLNWNYLLFIIVFIFGMEWILRRRSGTR